ncbi:MAG TPA: hypothetical protein VJ754_11250 [Anaerolineae bacterium]|nr:hypothetical protein [Anaerolineae bacterium]
MKTRKVFVIGDSLFAESLARMLASTEMVRVVGCAPTPQAALPLLDTSHPDAVIVAGENDMSTMTFGPVLTAYPDLPVICADLNVDSVRVITSQRIGARASDLLAAVAGLPKRRQMSASGTRPRPAG